MSFLPTAFLTFFGEREREREREREMFKATLLRERRRRRSSRKLWKGMAWT